MIQIVQQTSDDKGTNRDTIYFVCTGNTCRSPMAEALFRKAVFEIQPSFPYKISSGGIMAFPGQTASQGSIEVLKKIGIDISSHRSKQFTNDLAKTALAVFGMTAQHVSWMRKNLDNISFDQIYLMGDERFLSKPFEIPDPIGGEISVYQHLLECMQQRMPKLVEYILRHY